MGKYKMVLINRAILVPYVSGTARESKKESRKGMGKYKMVLTNRAILRLVPSVRGTVVL